jgi:hypothetical protein
VVSTWLGDHQGRPSAPLSRRVKVSKYEVLKNMLQLQLQSLGLYFICLERYTFAPIIHGTACVIGHCFTF